MFPVETSWDMCLPDWSFISALLYPPLPQYTENLLPFTAALQQPEAALFSCF